MKILALDCATKTGWAWCDTATGAELSGVQDFSKKRGESNGMMFLRFNGWLRENWRDVDVIYYEQAHHRGGAATEIAVGLTTRVQEFCEEHKIEYSAVHTGRIKKATVGKGNASKEDMMKWFAEMYGREPIDDNEADAVALLEYAKADLGIGENDEF